MEEKEMTGLRLITEEDMRDKGNVGKPDTPDVPTAEMQRIMDELPREVIAPIHNQNIRYLQGLGLETVFNPTMLNGLQLLYGYLTEINCGTFTGTEPTPLELHEEARNAHSNMIVDGKVRAASAPTQTLEEHEKDPNAHANMIVDGAL